MNGDGLAPEPWRSAPVELTIVIPTFNRRDQLWRVLEALDRQVPIPGAQRSVHFEVVVVSDGSTDGTGDMVGSIRTSYRLRLIEQLNAGPAAARNLGVELAEGPLILFIDDDVVPEPECVSAHLEHHARAPDTVVIGPMLTPTDVQLSAWVEWEQHQLEKQYRRFAPGEPAYARQFYTGNASLSRAAFQDAGGFDTTFRRAEDVELALRMDLNGQAFAFEPTARAFHYAERSLASWMQIAFDYGRHDVEFARNGRPDLFQLIADFFADRHPLQRSMVLVAMRSSTADALLRSLMLQTAAVFHKIGFDIAGRWLLSGVYGLNYYGGVAHELGSRQAFRDLIRGRCTTGDFSGVFVLEQTLGHITHSKNLERLVPRAADFRGTFLKVDSSLTGWRRRIPGWSNWTVRAGLRARRDLRTLYRSDRHFRADALFVHSQVPAVLLGRWMQRIPTVVSLDATPQQYDDLGAHYSHSVGAEPVERLKHWLNRRCFARARHLVAWSDWAMQGLVSQYGVSPERVTVIPPGVEIDTWVTACDRARRTEPVRILFVGGDLRRKGGDLLIEASRRLRMNEELPPFEVHLVTNSEIAAERGVIVHSGLTANSTELIEQYHLADIFCLPTHGDCLPMVLAEAGAAGLPLISTDVGAIAELVRDGETGRLIPPGDLQALINALEDLITSPDKRLDYGGNARALVERDHDAATNSTRIISILCQVGDRR